MPHLRVRGVDQELIRQLSHAILDQMVEIVQAPRDWFTIEAIHSTYFFDGQEKSPGALMELLWFDRGQDVKDRLATAITEIFKPHIPEGQDITLIFRDLRKNDYFENGEHY
ncbi:MAG: DUF1904 family protein [Myxococcales bacterium]|nr:DUF1904 family protein [Myxococcales bacterium]